LRLEICHNQTLDDWIKERHYLHSTPAGAKLRLWIKDDQNNIIGVMMWGRPTARTYDQEKILELTRMYMIDDTEPNAESKALGMARKLIRKELPQVKGLLAYSSTGEGHKGTIYEADNWFALGTTAGRSCNRKSRRSNADSREKFSECITRMECGWSWRLD
jgi:hypothetical protein